MSLPLLRIHSAAVLLLAIGASPAAQAMFEPGAETSLCAGLGLDPGGVMSLADGSLWALDAGLPCRDCVSLVDRVRCRHGKPNRLLHCRLRAGRAADRGQWRVTPICELPPTLGGLVGRQGNRVWVNDRVWGLQRFQLAWKRGAWAAGASEVVLDDERIRALGLPRSDFNIALAPDGSLVLAFARSVARLTPVAGSFSTPKLTWLLGQAPAAGGEPAADPEARMLPAVAADGTVYAVAGQERSVFRFDPGEPKAVPIAHGKDWPSSTFMPFDAAVLGRQLLVRGVEPETGKTTMVALTPKAEGAGYALADLGIASGPDDLVDFTPEGHMLISDLRGGRIRCIQNLRAGRGAADAGTSGVSRLFAESLQAAAQRAAEAEAAREELLRQEPAVERKVPARAGKPGRARRGGRRPPAILAGARAAATAAPAAPAAPAPPARAGRQPMSKARWKPFAETARTFAESERFAPAFADWAWPFATDAPAPAPGESGPGLGPFSLSRAALERVVRWMLRNADEANHPAEVAEWLAQGRPAHPQFAFGLYERPGRPGILLELDELQAFAGRIDDDAGTVLVAEEIAQAGGVSGVRTDADGEPRYLQGVILTVDGGDASLLSVRPGGSPGLAPPAPEARSR